MNRKLAIGVVVGFLAAQFFAEHSAAQEKTPKKLELKTTRDKAAYSIGAVSARQMRRLADGQGLGLDYEVVLRGFREAISGVKPALSDEDMDAAVQALQDEVAERNATAGEAFLAANKSKPGVKVTASGLQIKPLKKGTGRRPNANDVVVVHYRGKSIDGKEFESSYTAGQPATLPVQGVIAGWSEALKLMEVGSKWEIYVPSDLAYGPVAQGVIGPNSTLVFELELVDIAKPEGLEAPVSRPATKAKPGKPAETEN
jgi:FKBP-type peptidyl-prolyl cis-trans isomerase FklB